MVNIIAIGTIKLVILRRYKTCKKALKFNLSDFNRNLERIKNIMLRWNENFVKYSLETFCEVNELTK